MEKEYIVLLHNLDAGSSALLGEFDSSDNYNIADNIKQELVKANKLISDYTHSEITATAQVGSYSFDFVAYVQIGEQNKRRISLFLKEKCKLGYVEKEQLTLLKYVIVQGEPNILELLKKEFNMYTHDDSVGVDMANSNLQAILDRKAKVSARAKFLLTEMKTANRAYVFKMLSLIKISGAYGTQLVNQFKEIVKSQKLDKNSDSYWHSLKVILDKLIVANALLFDENIMKRMESLQRQYMYAILNAKEPVVSTTAKPNSKSDDKKDDKGKGGGKGGDKGKDKDKDKSASGGGSNVASATSKIESLGKGIAKNKKDPKAVKPAKQKKSSVFFTNVMSGVFDNRKDKVQPLKKSKFPFFPRHTDERSL